MIESSVNVVFVEMQNGIAVRPLVAGVGERVERERVILGRGDFFFDESTEDARFDGRQRDLHVFDDSERGLRRSNSGGFTSGLYERTRWLIGGVLSSEE